MRSAEEWAEDVVRKWQSVDPFSLTLIGHAKLGLERDIAEFARAYARECMTRQAERILERLQQANWTYAELPELIRIIFDDPNCIRRGKA